MRPHHDHHQGEGQQERRDAAVLQLYGQVALFTLVISGFPGLRQIDYNIFLILPALQVLYPLIQGQTVPLELGGLLIRQSQKVIIKRCGGTSTVRAGRIRKPVPGQR